MMTFIINKYLLTIIYGLVFICFIFNSTLPIFVFFILFFKSIKNTWYPILLVFTLFIVTSCTGIINSTFYFFQISSILPSSALIIFIVFLMCIQLLRTNATIPSNIIASPFLIAIIGSFVGLANNNERALAEIQNHLSWLLFPCIYLYIYNCVDFNLFKDRMRDNIYQIILITLLSYLFIARADVRGLEGLYGTNYNKIDGLITPLLPALLFLIALVLLQAKFTVLNTLNTFFAAGLLIITFSRGLLISSLIFSLAYGIYKINRSGMLFFVTTLSIISVFAVFNFQYFEPLIYDRLDSALYRQTILSAMLDFFNGKATMAQLTYGLGLGAVIPLDLSYKFDDSPAYWIEIEILKIGYNSGILGVSLYIYFFLKNSISLVLNQNSDVHDVFSLLFLTAFAASVFSGQVMSQIFAVIYAFIRFSISSNSSKQAQVTHATE